VPDGDDEKSSRAEYDDGFENFFFERFVEEDGVE
jgi:hypothetical protein